MSTFFKIDNLEINSDKLFLILGPCVIEDEEMLVDMAGNLKSITEEIDIPFIFKTSFDKANRSSIKSFRGPGIEKGLKILKRIKEKFNIPILSDIHESWQAEPVSEVLSAIQIPAFLCRQTDLLIAAGKTGLPVNVKKGQFMAPEDMIWVVEKIKSTGNEKILLTERGTFFGYRNLVVDFKTIPVMRKTGCPVVIDATHSVQKPGASSGVSGGDSEYIPVMAYCGIVSGANGVFFEVHPNPKLARSDAENSLELKKLKGLLIGLKKLYNMNL